MNGFPVPFRFIAVALLSGILLFIGVQNFRDRTLWTVPSDGVFWSEDQGALIAVKVDPDGPGSLAGVRLGDRLHSINTQPVTDIGQYSDLIYELGSGASVVYRLEDETGSRNIGFNLESAPVLTTIDVFRAIVAFFHLGIGLFVLLRGDRSSRTYHFFFICLAAFVVYLYSYTTKLSILDWWVYGLSVLAFLLLPALFVHFCIRFPIETRSSIRTFPIYIPALLLVVLQVLWIAGRLVSIGLPLDEYSRAIIDNIHLAYFSAGFLLGGTLLFMKHLKTRDLIARQQMKWVSFGTLAGILPFSLAYILPVLIGFQANFAMESTLLFLALIPLSTGYALIHYRLLDVERIARQGAAYFIASTLLLALYLLFVLVLGRAVQWIAPQADFLIICLAVLVIALLFAPLRNAVQVRLDRLFYKDLFEDRSSLRDFARKLSSEMNLETLSHSIADRVSKTFRIDCVAVFLADSANAGLFRLTYSRDSSMRSGPTLFREDVLFNSENPDSLFKTKSGADGLKRAHPSLKIQGFSHLLELKLHERRVGIIALGRLPGNRHFSTEDLDLLTTLAGYAAMALENALLYRSVETKAIELERLKAYTDNIIESINVAVLALDAGGRITSCNRAFEELYGATREQITGSGIEEIFPRDILTSIQRIGGTDSWDIKSPGNMSKLYMENNRGKRLFVNLSFIPLQETEAAKPGCLIVLDDITEKADLEEQLLQAEKLSSIGLLAAGIAHEINTPIAGISSYTQMLLKDLPESDKRKKVLEKIENQTFRAAEIVSGLLNFSRMSDSRFKDLDINQLIHESLILLKHQLQGSQIKVESKFNPSLPKIYGNSGKLQQVFINLFLNARDAMPSGGDLKIETGMYESMVVIDILDTGTGISEEHRKRIFDPFFTTKTVGKGTGLGLSVSYGIIQEHGGRILVDSSAGKGTHFKLKLPTRLQ
ncbi:MAG: PAS domain S-box protein [Acidobacteria bacterium]|nr:PAS domain S-box protein [Acidobacteriota bacterium]